MHEELHVSNIHRYIHATQHRVVKSKISLKHKETLKSFMSQWVEHTKAKQGLLDISLDLSASVLERLATKTLMEWKRVAVVMR